ncbi:MAG: polysaccharide biosynthesis C-terminal domain-containing protein [Chitinophagales bacterium]|nr:polysaccharide biosynthesis C-terminal domain-containing protein [Chitinophagales bacterium]
MGIIQRQGLKNTAVTFTGLLLGFISLLYVQPRFLAPEEIGLTRVLFSLSSLIGVFLPLGIGTITVKYFPVFRNPQNGHNGFFGLILLFMFTGAVVIFSLLIAAKGFFVNTYQEQSRLFTEFYYYVLPLSFIIGFNAVLTLYSNSLFRTTFPALFNEILVRVISIVLFTVYYSKLINLSAFVFLFVGIYGTQTVCLLLYLFLIDKPSINVNWNLLKEGNFAAMLKFGLWMSFVSVASMGIKYIDALVIAKYYKLELVGIYTIAAFIPNIIEAPLNALDRIAGTKISQALAQKDYNEIKKIYYLSSHYLLVICGLIFIGIVTNIEFILQLLPPKYSGGLSVVIIISIGAMFNIAGGAITQIIFSSDNFWKGGTLLIVVMIVTLLLNLVLVPVNGLQGAATATALSAALYFAAKFWIVYRSFGLQPYSLKTLQTILIIILICFGVWCLPQVTSPIANIAFRSVSAIMLYAGIVLFLNLAPDLKQLAKNAKSMLRF